MSPDRKAQEMPSRAEQGGEWCVRLSTGSLSPDEQASFDKWMADDPLNREAFDQALTVWQGLHAIGDSPELISRRADALEALRRANSRRWSRRFASNRQWVAGIAACFALVLVSTFWLFSNRPELYGTGVGERRVVMLEDGSRLSLDAETKVSALYSSDQRKLVLLSGRAKFDVARDLSRPFTVTAGDRTVIATGTAFSVELLNHKVHVIVYEGSVAVVAGVPPPADQLVRIKQHPAGDAIPLSPGKELVDGTTAGAPTIVNTDVSRSLAWEAGQLNFVDEPMASAVERLNRYSSDKIVIGDPKVASIRINGVFNAGDSAAFADAVSQAYPVEVERDGNDFVLASSSSSQARKNVM